MSVAELARVLTPENRGEILPRFFRLSKREAQALAATLAPRENPPLREVVTTIRSSAAPALALADPEPSAPERSAVQPVEPARSPAAPAQERDPGPDAIQVAPPPAPPARPPPTASEPLGAELSRLHVTVSRRFLAKLEKAWAALSHAHPGAGAEEILEAGLDLLLERHEKRRGIVARPRREPPPPRPEHVPAHVKRAVWKRDGGRCQWNLDGGGICGSTHRAQLDHILPWARGGPSTVENLRVLCAVHNDRAARLAYGNDWMDRFTGVRGRGDEAAPGP